MDDLPAEGFAAVARLASVQAGCVAIWQARALGVSTDRISRRRGPDGWRDLHRSVVALPGARDDEILELWAALLATADLTAAGRAPETSGPLGLRSTVEGLAAVAGWSAAVRRGYDRTPPARPQLLTPHTVTTEREEIRLIRSRRGIDGMWEWLDGLPVTTALRTMWDVGHLGRGLTGAVDHVADLATFFDRTRQLSIVELMVMVEEPVVHGLPRRPPPVLRAAVKRFHAEGFSHSGTEADARRIATEVAAELGVRLHPSPFPIRNERGQIVAEADIAAPALRFDAEIDGPHHRGPLAAAAHRRRDARTDPLDWVVRRYPVDDTTGRLDEDAFRAGFRNDLRSVMAVRLQQTA